MDGLPWPVWKRDSRVLNGGQASQRGFEPVACIILTGKKKTAGQRFLFSLEHSARCLA
jgi:hypothetical protein